MSAFQSRLRELAGLSAGVVMTDEEIAMAIQAAESDERNQLRAQWEELQAQRALAREMARGTTNPFGGLR